MSAQKFVVSASIQSSLLSDSKGACCKLEKSSPQCFRQNFKNSEENLSLSFAGCKNCINQASLQKSSNKFKVFAVASENSVHSEQSTQVENGADRPSAAQMARTLLEVCTEGTLSSIGTDSWPIGTSVKFTVDAEGSPIFLLDSDSIHAQHVSKDNRCSFHVNLALPGSKKPQCTLKGKVVPSEDDDINLRSQIAWKKRFGQSFENECLDKSKFYIMQIESILTWKNLGEKEVDICSQAYFESKPDPLRSCAFRIVEDMNREHHDDIRRFCYAFADIHEDVEDASLIWVDEFGFDMKVVLRETREARDVRLRFPRLVSDDRDARSSIMMMAQIAWEKERNYIPPEIPLLGHQSA